MRMGDITGYDDAEILEKVNKTTYIRVRLTEQEKNDITKLAKINQITVSELVRHMIYCETVLFAKGVSNAKKTRQPINN